MKTLILTSFLFFQSFNGTASNSYKDAMLEALTEMKTAQNIPAYQESANTFDRIAAIETKEWLPAYYSAFCYVIMAAQDNDIPQKDKFLEIAQNRLDHALSVAPAESEVVALQAFLYMIKITVDPSSRGAELSPVAQQTVAKALALNPENPRAVLLQAQLSYGTASYFGSDTSEACKLFDLSIQKFDSFKPASEIAPSWGKDWALNYINTCNKK